MYSTRVPSYSTKMAPCRRYAAYAGLWDVYIQRIKYSSVDIIKHGGEKNGLPDWYEYLLYVGDGMVTGGAGPKGCGRGTGTTVLSR